MNIIQLNLRNFKRITAFSVALENGENMILSGTNGAGKSSVLDGILLALSGQGLADPVKHGTSKASVKLSIGGGDAVEYVIEKRFTAKTKSLVVTTADGSQVPSPQAFLDSLIGSLAFDPLEFVRLGKDAKGCRQQAAMIRELSGLDTSKLDADYQTAFAQRTVLNKALDEAKAQLKGLVKPEVPERLELPEIDDVAFGELDVSASELIVKRDMLLGAANAAKSAFKLSDEAGQAVRVAIEKVRELERQLQNAKVDLACAEKRDEELAKVHVDLEAKAPSEAEFAAITQQIKDVDKVNAGIRARREAHATAAQKAKDERAAQLRANETAIAITQRALDVYQSKEKAAKDAAAKAEAITDKLTSITDQKTALTNSAKMPIAGMTFDEDGVCIDGVRFDQLSTAEQIKASALVAMASNPKLKIILIREGALVSKANMAVIVEAAKDKGFQILLEKFAEEPGQDGLFIEDGTITHIDGAPVVELKLNGGDEE